MSDPLSPEESLSIFDELTAALGELDPPAAPAASGLSFDEPEEEAQQPEFEPGAPLSTDPQPFIFGQESNQAGQQLTGLERMGDKLARAIRPALEPIARARVSVTAEPLEIRSYAEWQAEQPEFSALTLYRLRPLKGGMLIQLAADCVAALVEIFYGGAPGAPRSRKPGDFTAAEDLLLNRLLEKLSTILAYHWNEVTPIDLAFGARETNVAHVPFVRGDEMVVVQKFTLSGGIRPTVIKVLYPLAMLRPIQDKLQARAHDEDLAASEDWRWRLGQALMQISLPVRSVLARPEISVAELLALKPGDVIPINLPPRTPLLAGAQRIADGVIGEQDGRAALMIEQVGIA